MTIGQLILWLMIGTPTERQEFRMRMKNFCEKHLIADDPYDEQTREFREEEQRRRDNESKDKR